MQVSTEKRWQSLCEKASNEHDSKRLMELIYEIDRLLDEKEQRLKPEKAKKQSAA